MPEISNYFKIHPGKIGDYATFYQLQLDACGFNQRASGLTPFAKKEGPLISASTGSGIRPSTNNPKEVFPASLSCRLGESRPWITSFWRGLSSGDTGCEVPLSCPEACWLSRGQLLGGLAHLPSRTLLLGVKNVAAHSESHLEGRNWSCDTLRSFVLAFAKWMRGIFHYKVLRLPPLMLLRNPQFFWPSFRCGKAGWRQIPREPPCGGGRGPAAHPPKGPSLVNSSTERNLQTSGDSTQLLWDFKTEIQTSGSFLWWQGQLQWGRPCQTQRHFLKDVGKSEPWILHNSGVAWCEPRFGYCKNLHTRTHTPLAITHSAIISLSYWSWI